MRHKVKAIPYGLHTLTPHLIVRDAGKAIDFYERAFGAEEINRMPGPDGKSVWHVQLRIGDSNLFLADEATLPGARSPETLGGECSTLQMYVEDAEAAFKRAVDAGCKVKLPLADRFWGDRYGQLTDPFGYQWAIAQRVQELTHEELVHAVKAAAAFAKK
jgi:uncharacterized glyoxalase superfamily protein PhnB